MPTPAAAKERYARLLYERMLGKKYLIQTCFTGKREAQKASDLLEDLRLQIHAQ